MNRHKWEGAAVPREGTTIMSFRGMPEENDRLEALREQLGLRSKSQVLRVALDVLEELFVATDFSDAARSETRAMMGRFRDRVGVGTPEDAENHQQHRRRVRAQLRHAGDAVREQAAAAGQAVREAVAVPQSEVRPAEV